MRPNIFKQVFQGSATPSLELIEITRDSRPELIATLVGRDAVHKTNNDSVENIQKHRLGGAAFNRTCFAVQSEGELHGAIYVHKQYTPIKTPADLCGNVRDILETKSTFMGDAQPTSFILYSITRLTQMKGAGDALIRQLHAHVSENYPNVFLSTLSPLRQPVETDKYCIDDHLITVHDWDERCVVDQKAFALSFLMMKMEGVQGVHMGKGAIIADIKLDGDSVGKHRIMVNYFYNSDAGILAENAAGFRAAKGGDILELASGELRQETQNILPQILNIPRP
ncbi:MAG: hypothetical protein DI551_12190 [Micavibrio aeruginosavorus]|uniref:Uncharacterized protein n=1 Tax=Micavibrio aeruginosavorus TaxID=349221 RepID=A0A2W5MTA5_9BACT|nr:MAG: hypothetical protein DI551_12190 [Micavibrio aeruginosavorus]